MAVKQKKAARPAHAAPKQAPEERGGRRNNRSGQTFDNTNRGVLFQNDKDGIETRPDNTGTADIQIPDDARPGEVIKFRIAGWVKSPKNGGDDFLSLVFQKADQQGSNRN